MKCCSMILAKELFVDKEDLKNTNKSRINMNRDDSNHGKKKVPSKIFRQKILIADTVLLAVKMH